MNGQVRLKLGRREFFSGGGFSGSFAPVSVKVKNIAFAKDVAVHYTPGGNVWKDFALGFSSHFGDYDIFSGTVSEQVEQFVVRYSAAAGRFTIITGGKTTASLPTSPSSAGM